MPKGHYLRTPKMISSMSKAFKGRIISEEQKRQISQTMKGRRLSSEHIASLRGKIHILKPGIYRKRGPMSDSHKHKIGLANKNRIHTDEARHNMSIAHRGATPRLKTKTEWYTSPTAGCIFLRSSYESVVARWLDKNRLDWKYEDILVEWVDSKGKSHTYFVDFHVIDKEEYCIECKGWVKPEDYLKFKAFKTQYPTLRFDLVTASDLVRYQTSEE